jgi:hypothetical protein
MKGLQLFVTCFILLMANISFAQTEQNSFSSEQKSELKKATKSSATNKVSRKTSIISTDEYMGKKKAFLRMLKNNQIPADFPKYDSNISAEQYKFNVRSWMKNNKDLLSEEFKKKLQARKANKK